MKTALVSLFMLFFGTLAHAADRWNDALSANSASPASNDSAALNTSSPDAGRANTSLARSIILSHLQQIRNSNLMVNTISLESYWQGVFAQAGHAELFDAARLDLETVLQAGLAPYFRGEPMNAQQFCDAAISALQSLPNR